MGKKAVDIVLLPDEAAMKVIIRANAELISRFGEEIVLNKKDCLPHISLAMGCIDEANISTVKGILETMAARHRLGRLRVIGVYTSVDSEGRKVSVFVVEKTQQLQRLHEEIMAGLGPYLSNEVSSEMLFDSEVKETTLLWIRNYRAKSSFGNFLPHITIGYGQPTETNLPIEFTASRLAMCHLGNHCTCRKILAEVEFGEGKK
jgi:hypothetical protein